MSSRDSIPPPGLLKIASSDDGHVIAQFNPLVIVHLGRKIKSSELECLRGIVAQGLRAGVRGGMLFVFARKDMAGGIDPEARSVFEQLIRDSAEKAGVSAVVILADGFAGAMARGFLAGLVRLSSRRKALQIFGTVAEACAWLAVHHELDSAKVQRAYAEATKHLRDAHSAPPSA